MGDPGHLPFRGDVAVAGSVLLEGSVSAADLQGAGHRDLDLGAAVVLLRRGAVQTGHHPRAQESGRGVPRRRSERAGVGGRLQGPHRPRPPEDGGPHHFESRGLLEVPVSRRLGHAPGSCLHLHSDASRHSGNGHNRTPVAGVPFVLHLSSCAVESAEDCK